MAIRRGIERGVRMGLVLSLLGTACAKPQRSPEQTPTRPAVSASPTAVKDTDPFLDPPAATTVPREYPTPEPQVPTATLADPPGPTATETEVPKLENPWKGHVFDQRCRLTGNYGNDGRPEFNCVEKWAARPLPKGCSNEFKNYEGSASCNATAVSFVLNELVPPEVFMRVIGQPGITPDVLIEQVYPNLPNGKGVLMGCSGVGPDTMKVALAEFGLTVHDVMLSEYTWADVVANLKPNQRLIIAMIGVNSKGHKYEHNSVPKGVGIVNGHKSVFFSDSYFYKDDKRAATDMDYRNHVFFEESPNIQDDPSRYTGKNFNIVGAFIVEAPESFGGVLGQPTATPERIHNDYQTEVVLSDKRLVGTEISFPAGNVELVGEPIRVGNSRYRIQVRYGGRMEDYYYFDPYGGGRILPPLNRQLEFVWGKYVIPLYMQMDPRWGGETFLVENKWTHDYDQFGKKGCGQAVGASILSMAPITGTVTGIDPFNFSIRYFPGLDGSGTYPKDYYQIFAENGFTAEPLTISPQAVERAVDQGKIVLIQGGVDFHWYNGASVDHFVLVLGRDANGELIIFDPYWGLGVTKIMDIDFSKSSGVMAIEYPG